MKWSHGLPDVPFLNALQPTVNGLGPQLRSRGQGKCILIESNTVAAALSRKQPSLGTEGQ